VRYFFPKYTGLPPKIEKNTDGSIQGLKGSIVKISFSSSAELESAQLIQ